MKDVIIPIVENDDSDFGVIKELLLREDLWFQATSSLPWLREYRPRPLRIQAASAEKTNRIDARAALYELLDHGALACHLDLGLSGDEERVIQRIGDDITDEAEMDRWWWSDEVKKVGGLWILRELHTLREKGFSVPVIAAGTGFGQFSAPSVPWTRFLLNRGATWVYPKPLKEDAARKFLGALVVLLAGGVAPQLTAKLGGLYHRARSGEGGELWDKVQLAVFDLLDRALLHDEAGSQKERAAALGIAYNTYRSWTLKVEDSRR